MSDSSLGGIYESRRLQPLCQIVLYGRKTLILLKYEGFLRNFILKEIQKSLKIMSSCKVIYLTFQSSVAYWRIVRSDENLPALAVFFRHFLPNAMRSL